MKITVSPSTRLRFRPSRMHRPRRQAGAQGDMMKKPFDWSADAPKLTMPVMLVYADSDMYRPEHVVKFYQLLGGGLKDAGRRRENMARSRLAILPGLTHYDIFPSPQLPTTVLPFLYGNVSSANWAKAAGAK